MSCTSNVSEPGDSVKTMRVFGAELALDRGARERIVVAHLDAEARQMSVAEPPRRSVDRVGDEDVVAGARQREQRQRRRREARRHRERRVAAFDLRDRVPAGR